jgi:ABC-type glycerol-3-phosphate transport system permease component
MTTVAISKPRLNRYKLSRQAVLYGVLLLVVLVMLIPVAWWILTSLKRQGEFLVYPILILPPTPQWQNYIDAVVGYNFPRYLGNSLFLAMTTGAITVAVNSLVGFAFARMRDVPGANRLFGLVVALLVMPGIIFTIPQFIVFSRLGLTNSYWPWILGALGGSAYHIFLFRQFFTNIPKELEEAAEVDGCGPFRIYWQIFLPNALPAVATSFIFHFAWIWGDAITPLLYLREDQMTLAVKLMNAYIDPQGNPIVPLQLAAAVYYTVPLVVMFFFAQKYIIKGAVTSGLKG